MKAVQEADSVEGCFARKVVARPSRKAHILQTPVPRHIDGIIISGGDDIDECRMSNSRVILGVRSLYGFPSPFESAVRPHGA